MAESSPLSTLPTDTSPLLATHQTELVSSQSGADSNFSFPSPSVAPLRPKGATKKYGRATVDVLEVSTSSSNAQDEDIVETVPESERYDEVDEDTVMGVVEEEERNHGRVISSSGTNPTPTAIVSATDDEERLGAMFTSSPSPKIDLRSISHLAGSDVALAKERIIAETDSSDNDEEGEEEVGKSLNIGGLRTFTETTAQMMARLDREADEADQLELMAPPPTLIVSNKIRPQVADSSASSTATHLAPISTIRHVPLITPSSDSSLDIEMDTALAAKNDLAIPASSSTLSPITSSATHRSMADNSMEADIESNPSTIKRTFSKPKASRRIIESDESDDDESSPAKLVPTVQKSNPMRSDSGFSEVNGRSGEDEEAEELPEATATILSKKERIAALVKKRTVPPPVIKAAPLLEKEKDTDSDEDEEEEEQSRKAKSSRKSRVKVGASFPSLATNVVADDRLRR
jgi:hypothetical protein